MKFVCLVLLCLVSLVSSISAAEKGWLVDWDAAKKKAVAEDKDIFIEFTGSDWCQPCINFKKMVLDTNAFKSGVSESFILLKLDSPSDKSKQTKKEIEQYRKLSAEFKVTSVPTVVLTDASGRPFVRMTGYGGQGPDAYVKSLLIKRDVRVVRDGLFEKAEKADGLTKARLFDKAISGIDSEFVISQYRDVVDQIIELDGSGNGGFRIKYEMAIDSANVRESAK